MSLVEFFNGAAVAFRLGDVHCPLPTEITARMADELRLEGRIVFLSDKGDHKEHYAIVNVRGLATPIVVPLEKLSRRDMEISLTESETLPEPELDT